jgi:hypothetical protein
VAVVQQQAAAAPPGVQQGLEWAQLLLLLLLPRGVA